MRLSLVAALVLMLGCAEEEPKPGGNNQGGPVGPADTGIEDDTGEPASDPDPEDLDGDGVFTPDDCDDNDATINPSAEEVCDAVDNDCDGEIDEGVSGVWYTDADGDGYGDGTLPVQACEQPSGTVDNVFDCDDSNPDSYPDAVEICDGRDNNCDGMIDNSAVDPSMWYPDADGDGRLG